VVPPRPDHTARTIAGGYAAAANADHRRAGKLYSYFRMKTVLSIPFTMACNEMPFTYEDMGVRYSFHMQMTWLGRGSFESPAPLGPSPPDRSLVKIKTGGSQLDTRGLSIVPMRARLAGHVVSGNGSIDGLLSDNGRETGLS